MDDRACNSPRALAGRGHARFTAWLAALLLACTSSHEEQKSTETGNPPALPEIPEIDAARVALVVSIDELHVQGDPGAVTPGGIEVEVMTLGSGDVQRGAVASDGSFDVAVDGTPYDTYELRAEDGTASSDPVFLIRGGAMVAEGEGGALSCEQRASIAYTQIREAAQANRSCTVDSDCTTVSVNTACHISCGPAPVSAAGAAEVQAVVNAIASGLCASFAQDGCRVDPPPCPMPMWPPVCVAGECRFEIPGPVDAGAMPEPVDAGAMPEPVDAGTMPDAGGECPPNARFVEDVCLMCGLAGGCGMTEARCALVCSADEHCAGAPTGSMCSPRGICEMTFCI